MLVSYKPPTATYHMANRGQTGKLGNSLKMQLERSVRAVTIGDRASLPGGVRLADRVAAHAGERLGSGRAGSEIATATPHDLLGHFGDATMG